ncbi:DUF427 domain-containing protein [Aquimarina sp. MMG016]|uniref:DUF427 domain-containing protein n=1 Tax=Aquimarina sp. MMG016 TaxID=2822690 RepID=UPI001B3A779E|nr:DUF427 domain-containing protein [Aquimarina sp. MMG016]MBQ4822449.1 DUF427 domain-containing protein [Aquimarina sp. MMG016]
MKKRKTKISWLQKARESWSHTGTKRPPFAIAPKKGQRSVWDFPRPPIIEKVNKPVLINHKGTEIARSCNVLAVLETASPPTYYIPKRDVNMSTLVSIPDKTSMCEWKGSAVYWGLKTMIDRPVAWSYPNPFPEFSALKEYIAFYPQHLECYIDGEQVKAQSSEFYAGWITSDLVGPFKGEPGTGHW